MKTTVKRFGGILLFSVLVIAACKHEPNLPEPQVTTNTGGNNTGNNTGDTTGNSNNNNNNNNNNDDSTTTQPVDTSLCFERDILPIFRSNCAKSGCHDAASHREGYILDSYNNIMNTGDDDGIVPGDAHESEIYEAITEDDLDKRMPLYPNPPLSTAQTNLIKRWINEGAQNGTNCAVLCDTANFAFAGYIQPIFQQNCVGCHNGTTTSGGVNLSTHAGASVVAQNGRLAGAINHQSGFTPMPLGSPKLSDCKIRQIEKWIRAGAPNN